MYQSKIRSVSYHVANNADTEAISFADIRESSSFQSGLPRPNGLFDKNMGVTEYDLQCGTCGKNKAECLGHFGKMPLPYPCINPLFIHYIRKWLQVICLSCGHLMITKEQLEIGHKLYGPNLLDKPVNLSITCPVDKKPRYRIKGNNKMKTQFQMEAVSLTEAENAKEEKNITLFPHHLVEIFSRLLNESVSEFAAGETHPLKCIFQFLPILPPNARPDMRQIGNSRATNSDSITIALRAFINDYNMHAESIKRDQIASSARDIEKFNAELSAILISNPSQDQKAIGEKIKAKEGLLRANLIGKRVFGMARAVILGDPRLKLDQISIPKIFAKVLQITEVVQPFNKDRLQVYVINGTRYPGCSEIKKKRNGMSYRPRPDTVLENGDIIQRDLIDGDIVEMNRQPSLTSSSITTLKVLIKEDSWGLAMNDLICVLFNADFDGDQMNMIGHKDAASRNEVRLLAGVPSHIISMTTDSVSIGLVEDSMVGLAKLTQSGLSFDQYHAGLLFATETVLPEIPKTLTGRDTISLTLERVPIDYSGESKYYSLKSPWTKYVGESPNDANVSIVNGKVLSGCLDSAVSGKGSELFGSIIRDYGPKIGMETIFNLHQIAISAILQIGFTMGTQDFNISLNSRKLIEQELRTILQKSEELRRKYFNGNIIAPVDKTVQQYYEELQINTLQLGDEFIIPILQSIAIGPGTGWDNLKKNGAFELMAIGSKGNLPYFTNMAAAIGQTILTGYRVPMNYGVSRSMVYFSRYDESPSARGFIASNYMDGMKMTEFVSNAMQARVEIIMKALMTSVTGEQNRRSVKSLESILSNNYGFAVKYQKILSFAYGGDYCDARKLMSAKYRPGIISDKKFKEEYYLEGETSDLEWSDLNRDRKLYREHMKRVELLTLREKVGPGIKVPFNIQRIVTSAVHELKKIKDINSESKGGLYERVREFIKEMPYLYINWIQYQNGGYVPEFVQSSVLMMTIYFRAEMSTARLMSYCKYGHKALLETCILKVSNLISNSRIAPGTTIGIISGQSFSEPFTQLVLDAYKASGSSSARSRISKSSEILLARPVSKLPEPMMYIALKENSKENAKNIANLIEILPMESLIQEYQIFYETFGKIVHKDYINEMETIYKPFEGLISKVPPLTSWVLRYKLNKSLMILKNVSTIHIVNKLNEIYPGIFVVYSTEVDPEVILRIHIKSNAHFNTDRRHIDFQNNEFNINPVTELNEAIMETVIRGVPGIRHAQVLQATRTKIDESGAVVDDNSYYIKTLGTNMFGIAQVPGILMDETWTDAISEMSKWCGIEAARARIPWEMKQLVEKCNIRHYMIYADTMTALGRLIAIDKSGLKAQENSSISLRASQGNSIQVLTNAAEHNIKEEIGLLSSSLLFGTVPNIGTKYNKVYLDPSMVAKKNKW